MTDQDKITAAKHSTIAAALAAAQAQMGRAMKSATNPHFRNKYADLASVMDACMPSLTANGIAVTQPVRREGEDLLLFTVLHHADSGEKLDDGGLPLLVNKRDMQGLGSALTYGRRYGLMAMAGIAPDDDDGNAAAAAPPKHERRAEPPVGPSPDQITDATSALAAATTLEALREVFTSLPPGVKSRPEVIQAKDDRKAMLESPANSDLDDAITY